MPIPKKDYAKECSKYYTSVLISHASSKSFKLGFNSTWMQYFQMYKLDLEKAEDPETKFTTSIGSEKKAREFHKNIYLCFTYYAKAFDLVHHNKLWKILKEKEIPDHLTSLLGNLYAGQEATVRTRHRTIDWLKIGKEIIKAVYCHPAYLTYMQSTSCEMPDWMNHKLVWR